MSAQRVVGERDQLRLTLMTNELLSSLYNSVNIFTYGLGGANGVFAASKSVEFVEFRDYVNSRDLSKEFPGALGFGFIQYLENEDVENFLLQVRSDGQPHFSIRTSGDARNKFIIKYIEPRSQNNPALGYDIGSEKRRREAAEQSMYSGLPTLTRSIQLLQDEKKEAGFLFMRPVYHHHQPIETAEQRQQAIFGWVYAPIILANIIEPTVSKYGEFLVVRVYEESERGKRELLYQVSEDDATDNAYMREKTFDIGQRRWTVTLSPREAFFGLDATRYFPVTVLVVCLLISFLIAAAAWVYIWSRDRLVIEHLKRGEEFVQGILDSTSFSIIVTEPDGIVRVFNRAASQMLGYAPTEVIGKETPQMIHEPEEVIARAAAVSQEFGRVIEPGFEVFVAAAREKGVDVHEWTYIRKDGSRFPVSLTVTAMRNQEGEIIAFTGIASDITERKKAEFMLQESEERFRTSFTHSSHGMALVSLEGRWLKVNHALCTMLDYSEEDLLQSTFQEITYTEDLDTDLALVKRCVLGELDNYHIEKRYLTRSKQVVWGLLSVSIVRDKRGKPLYFVSQIQDINARKLADLQLSKKTEELELAKQVADAAALAKGQFLANMSHEIRTPLTSIIGYSESLMQDLLTQEEKSLALETISKNGHHLLGVINDILDLSKIEAGKMDVDLTPTRLADLISDVANLMQHKANEKGLTLGFSYNFPIPRKIETDPIRLKQILINLIGNAVKFTAVGGVTIKIAYHEEQHLLSFAVIDTGPGLTPAQQSNLFKAFSQADTSITRKFGGTGLGLTISEQLAEKLGGKITLVSEEGKGSTFTLTISTGDLAKQNLVSTLPKTRIAPRTGVPDTIPQLTGRVLVAEDGVDNQRLISFLLKKTGLDFTIVDNGAKAVHELGKGVFDLVLMDVQMPIMDGYTATKKIREQGLTMPIIALTANAMKADIDAAFNMGCSDFLGKPFTRRELFSKLVQVLKDQASNVPVVPSSRTIELIEDDPEMLDLIGEIVANFPQRLNEISVAAGDGDWENVARLTHSLRGATGSLGFENLAELAGVIEIEAGEGAVAGIEGLLEDLDRLMNSTRSAVDGIKVRG